MGPESSAGRPHDKKGRRLGGSYPTPICRGWGGEVEGLVVQQARA